MIFLRLSGTKVEYVAKQSTIIIETKPHCMHAKIETYATLFFMVNLASGMDHGHVRPTSMTSCNMAAI